MSYTLTNFSIKRPQPLSALSRKSCLTGLEIATDSIAKATNLLILVSPLKNLR